MNEVKELLGLKECKIKIIKISEQLNNKEKIKVIKRNAYGYKNFGFFRLRLLYILNGKLSGRNKKNGK